MKLKEKAPTLKFWRGESGCPSYNDPKSGGALSEITATEPKQAKFLLRHLINDLYNDEIELSSYFHAYDFEHFTKKVRYHYGLIRHEDLTVKPSYGCFQTLAYLFGGAVRPDRETTLSCIAQKGDDMPTKEECASMKCYSFRRGDERIFAYDLPKEIDDCVVAKTVRLSLPRGILPERYVILDPLTKNLYPLCTADRFLSPLTDYPLLVVPRNTVSCPQTDGEPLCRDACADERQGDHE